MSGHFCAFSLWRTTSGHFSAPWPTNTMQLTKSSRSVTLAGSRQQESHSLNYAFRLSQSPHLSLIPCCNTKYMHSCFQILLRVPNRVNELFDAWSHAVKLYNQGLAQQTGWAYKHTQSTSYITNQNDRGFVCLRETNIRTKCPSRLQIVERTEWALTAWGHQTLRAVDLYNSPLPEFIPLCLARTRYIYHWA